MCGILTGEEGKVWGLGGEPSGWGRGRWNGALSFYLLETSPPSRPHPHTQPEAGHTPTAGWEELPPPKTIAYRCSRKGGVESREGRMGVQRRKTEGRRG